MGLFSCFGLRTRSYNAKKYELSDNGKDNKKKNRRSTDFVGVADTNVYPQLIEETGGEVHSIRDIKDTDDRQCPINNNHKEDNKENKVSESDDKVCDDCAEQQTEEHHKANDQQNNDSDKHPHKESNEDPKSHETGAHPSEDRHCNGHQEQSHETKAHPSEDRHCNGQQEQSPVNTVSFTHEVTSHNTSDHSHVTMDTTTASDFSGGADSSGGDCGSGDCGGGDCGGGD